MVDHDGLGSKNHYSHSEYFVLKCSTLEYGKAKEQLLVTASSNDFATEVVSQIFLYFFEQIMYNHMNAHAYSGQVKFITCMQYSTTGVRTIVNHKSKQ